MAIVPDPEEKPGIRDDLTPEEELRLHTAVGILVQYLLDNPPVNWENETGTDVTSCQAIPPDAEQLRFDL